MLLRVGGFVGHGGSFLAGMAGGAWFGMAALEGAVHHERGGSDDQGDEHGVGRGRPDGEEHYAVVDAGLDGADAGACVFHFWDSLKLSVVLVLTVHCFILTIVT